MKEAQLRTVHRRAGMFFFIFIVLQSLTGLILTAEFLPKSAIMNSIHAMHTRFEPVGDITRFLAGMGMLFMAVTGAWIGMKVRMRTRGSSVR